jgi:hypothetical protein
LGEEGVGSLFLILSTIIQDIIITIIVISDVVVEGRRTEERS